MKRTLLLALSLTVLTSCSSGDKIDSVQSQPTATQDASGGCTPTGKGSTDLSKKPVSAYLKEAEPTETTIHEIVCGTGAEAKEGSAVKVKYVGVLFKNGKEFDSSWSRGPEDTLPFSIGGGVIAGFSKGALGMKVGGRREVIIPSKDGYGEQGTGPIPPGATLVFLIDLVSVG